MVKNKKIIVFLISIMVIFLCGGVNTQSTERKISPNLKRNSSTSNNCTKNHCKNQHSPPFLELMRKKWLHL